jgi:hypothetical protein
MLKKLARELLKQTVSNDYVDYILNVIIDDVKEDVLTSADENFNEDDVRFAIGRVLMKKLGIEV